MRIYFCGFSSSFSGCPKSVEQCNKSSLSLTEIQVKSWETAAPGVERDRFWSIIAGFDGCLLFDSEAGDTKLFNSQKICFEDAFDKNSTSWSNAGQFWDSLDASGIIKRRKGLRGDGEVLSFGEDGNNDSKGDSKGFNLQRIKKVVTVLVDIHERNVLYAIDGLSVFRIRPSSQKTERLFHRSAESNDTSEQSFSGEHDFTITDLVAGREHVLFLSSTGQVYGCGLSSRGQLGNSHLNPVENPEQIAFFVDLVVRQIAAGGWSSMALTSDGAVFVWGWNSAGALGLPNRAVRERCGKVGDVKKEDFVEMAAEPRYLKVDEKVIWISCGMRHAGCITESKRIYLWGLNQHGQLATGDRMDRDAPTLVNLLEKPAVPSKIFCGEWSTFVFVEEEDCGENM